MSKRDDAEYAAYKKHLAEVARLMKARNNPARKRRERVQLERLRSRAEYEARFPLFTR